MRSARCLRLTHSASASPCACLPLCSLCQANPGGCCASASPVGGDAAPFLVLLDRVHMPMGNLNFPLPVPARSGHGPTLTGLHAARVLTKLAGPLVGGGVLARRRKIMPLLERLQTDADTVRVMAGLRRDYVPGQVQLELPGRTVVLPLLGSDVARILQGSPQEFTPANREKRAALEAFQPHGVLISRGGAREPRRLFNEQLLDTDLPVHHLAGSFATTIRSEIRELISYILDKGGVLDGPLFIEAWWRLVRILVLGQTARDDDAVTDDLWKLRSRGNWSYVLPTRHRLREKFFDQLYDYVDRADPLSLAGAVAAAHPEAAVDPVGQIPHWLFAFDAAGMVTLRALAVLAAEPQAMDEARQEATAKDLGQPQILRYLQSCVLESVRLWPTTPAILRDSTTTTTWGSGSDRFDIAPGAAFLILASAFHRDASTLAFADVFTPEAWLDGRAEKLPGLVPFSSGPARCPGENLVLFVTSMVLANLIEAFPGIRQLSTPPLSAEVALPATVDHYSITLRTR